jgi:ankyrin repeat protein
VPQVKLLLFHGANVNARCLRNGRTALHYAAETGRTEICRFLIDRGAVRSILDEDEKVRSS